METPRKMIVSLTGIMCERALMMAQRCTLRSWIFTVSCWKAVGKATVAVSCVGEHNCAEAAEPDTASRRLQRMSGPTDSATVANQPPASNGGQKFFRTAAEMVESMKNVAGA